MNKGKNIYLNYFCILSKIMNKIKMCIKLIEEGSSYKLNVK